MPDLDLDFDYTFCDTASSVQAALPVLRNSAILAFDCEGQHLGTAGGRLSLISLHAIQPPSPDVGQRTFIFDVLRLKRKALRGVYDILESDDVLKVVFDGRKDYSCLFHDRRVVFRNVIDLQLADIRSRHVRGEGDAARMNRLKDCMQPSELYRNRHLYRQVHKLNGLKNCAKEHIGYTATRGPRFDHSLWLERPLAEDYIRHAVEDVVLICSLYLFFRDAGYLYSQISGDSMRYVSIYNDRQPTLDDGFRSHGLLPLDILDHAEGGIRGTCVYCERSLPKSCFSKGNWAGGVGNRQCQVCRAVMFPPFWLQRKRLGRQ
ncbi:hypothetical protein D9615_006308 [Tricholomella constricta]|uniref:3'-5' exonuclease domain-containing protein n=1 Tax=Tricholomella constricta TaxID=117010 RepID=A0A8H5HAV6_9AGAR|nr:hypothetical protein D9615_006308 [Tricholomella constricta]